MQPGEKSGSSEPGSINSGSGNASSASAGSADPASFDPIPVNPDPVNPGSNQAGPVFPGRTATPCAEPVSQPEAGFSDAVEASVRTGGRCPSPDHDLRSREEDREKKIRELEHCRNFCGHERASRSW